MNRQEQDVCDQNELMSMITEGTKKKKMYMLKLVGFHFNHSAPPD